MPRVRNIQQRFTQGELDPRMIARVDIDQYYGALESALNIFPIPQGVSAAGLGSSSSMN